MHKTMKSALLQTPMDLIEHPNRIRERRAEDLSRIVPDGDEAEADATAILAPNREGEDDFAEGALMTLTRQTRNRGDGMARELGIVMKREMRPGMEADPGTAKRDSRSIRGRSGEQERWHRLFDSGYIAGKLNERGGVADLSPLPDVRPRTLRELRREPGDDRGWRRWEPRVSFAERDRKIDQEMSECIIGHVRDDFIAEHKLVSINQDHPTSQSPPRWGVGPWAPLGNFHRYVHAHMHF